MALMACRPESAESPIVPADMVIVSEVVAANETAVPTPIPSQPETNQVEEEATTAVPIAPTETLPPTYTAVPPTATPIPPTPTPTPPPLNGIPISSFIILPPEVQENVRQIFTAGQEQGRNPRTFSKLGDSTSLNPNYMGKFENPADYVLGDYAYLQPTIDHYDGHFARYGVATRNGLHSWSVFDPLWADKRWCEANEDILACEFRLNNPSILFVKLGSNDAGAPSGYRYNMRMVVETAVANGVIPILVTKADRFEGEEDTNNKILRELAAQFNVPLLDFDVVADTLPNRGLKPNDVHMAEVGGPHDFTNPDTFTVGHAVHDLAALLMLDALRSIINP